MDSNETRLQKFKPQSLGLQKEAPGCPLPKSDKSGGGGSRREVEKEIQNWGYFSVLQKVSEVIFKIYLSVEGKKTSSTGMFFGSVSPES